MLRALIAGIALSALMLATSAEALDEKIQTAIDDGIITLSEGELVQDGVNDGSIEFIDVNSDDGILVFGVIYYDDEKAEEEVSQQCPATGTHLNK